MKAKTGLKVATWIVSIGLAVGFSALACLLVMSYVPAPGTPFDPVLLLAVSIGLGIAAFGVVWFIYRLVKIHVFKADSNGSKE
ncbi:MAG: hypothetical protein J7M40_13150 [Planctomycetes bacterium]|nr:hypothetical protein [Planctomycetota bacterium]